MHYNAYNTTDPEKLLELKRQEALIMLDIVRSIHPGESPRVLIKTIINKIIEQLDVNKLIFINNILDYKILEYNHNFEEIHLDELNCIDHVTVTSPIEEANCHYLTKIGAEYIIPLGRHFNETPAGWFIIADFAESEAETKNDIIFIETVGNILIISLENIFLFEEKVAKELIQQELDVAGRIQKQALPNNFDIHPFIDLYAFNIAHYKVAGDFYDVIPINENEVYLCMADVAGKGIAAALLVATLQANLRALVQAAHSLNHIVSHLHLAIKRITRSEHFVTIFLAKFNIRTHKLAYINAGHNPPFIVRDGLIYELNKGCLPLGILPLENIDLGHEKLSPGDLLFMFTDGIVEQFDEKNEMLGVQQVKRLISDHTDLTANKMAKLILNKVFSFAQNVPTADDMSLMIVKYLKEPKPKKIK